MLAPMQWAMPIVDDQRMQGWIVHVDRFGNCITNVSREVLEEQRAGRSVKCYVGNTILKGIQQTYASVDSGEPLIHYNGSRLLEIAVNTGNASALLSIRKGDPVHLFFLESP